MTAAALVPPSIQGFVDLRLIGTGGFSSVWSATETAFKRQVAIKVIDATGNEARRLQREALALGALAGIPHILQPHAAVTTDDGRPSLVLPLMASSIAAEVAAKGRIDQATSMKWAFELSGALDEVHARGVFHRDIKPQNILIDGRDGPFVADFGIAALAELSASTVTAFSVSPPHAPPERFLNNEGMADPHAAAGDRYSFASTIFTAMVGVAPFGTAAEGGTAGLIARITGQHPARPTIMSKQVYEVFEQALAKDPGDRFSTCIGFVEHLKVAVSTGTGPARPQATPVIDLRSPKWKTPAESTTHALATGGASSAPTAPFEATTPSPPKRRKGDTRPAHTDPEESTRLAETIQRPLPPAVEIERPSGSSIGDPASLSHRATAFVIDSLVIIALATAAWAAVWMVLIVLDQRTDDAWPVPTFVVLSCAAALALIYQVVGDSLGRQTFGRNAMGIRVVRSDGDDLSAWQAAGRGVSKVLSTVPLLFGWVMPIWDQRRRALHDRIVETEVRVAPTTNGSSGLIRAFALTWIVVVAAGTAASVLAGPTASEPIANRTSGPSDSTVSVGSSGVDPKTTQTSREAGEVDMADEAAALAELQRLQEADRPKVQSLVGSWVPVLSSKTKGTKDNDTGGIWRVFSFGDVLKFHRDLISQYENAVLINSSDFKSKNQGLWMTIVATAYTEDEVKAWCAMKRLAFPANCLAKKLLPVSDP